MKTYIALFIGINVGGRGTLPMKELVLILEGLGCQNIQTYIQSGNAVFKSDASDTARLAKSISAEVEKCRGFAPHILLLKLEQLRRQLRTIPSLKGKDPNTLHVGFLASAPKQPDLKNSKYPCGN